MHALIAQLVEHSAVTTPRLEKYLKTVTERSRDRNPLGATLFIIFLLKYTTVLGIQKRIRISIEAGRERINFQNSNEIEKEETTVAESWVNDIMLRFCAPEVLVSDNGLEYTNKMMAAVNHLLRTRHVFKND